MTIVLSVLLVVCLVAIGYLCVAWARDAHTSDVIAAEMNRICDDVRDRLRLSKAECVGLSDQVAGLKEELEKARSLIVTLRDKLVQRRDTQRIADRHTQNETLALRKQIGALSDRLKEIAAIASEEVVAPAIPPAQHPFVTIAQEEMQSRDLQ
jgi:uncharacterized coiled-coil protein SlyX